MTTALETAQRSAYILNAFLGFQAPTGSTVFTQNAWLITPTIAGGIGFGDCDVQATLASPLPVGPNAKVIGRLVVTNVALQYLIIAA